MANYNTTPFLHVGWDCAHLSSSLYDGVEGWLLSRVDRWTTDHEWNGYPVTESCGWPKMDDESGILQLCSEEIWMDRRGSASTFWTAISQYTVIVAMNRTQKSRLQKSSCTDTPHTDFVISVSWGMIAIWLPCLQLIHHLVGKNYWSQLEL